jgi:hypothetical protein
MNAAEALCEARKYGAVFTVKGPDQVRVSAPLPLPGSLLSDLKAHKLEIIRLLGKEPDYSLTACTCDKPIGGTGDQRCRACALPLTCPGCSRCRGCRLALRFNKGRNGCDREGGLWGIGERAYSS